VLLCWLPVGRNLLRAQRGFVRVLWREAMRGEGRCRRA
jgi:hypothetical protein